MSKAAVSLMADFEELSAVTGAITGVSKVVNTKRFLGELVKYAHSEMSKRFDLFMDLQYKDSHGAFHHVYEWNAPGGNDASRLWQHRLIGHGASRNATWTWKASKIPVPTPSDRRNNPNDPMSAVPLEEMKHWSENRYWFYWKAPVMESGQEVTIAPKNVKKLMFPTGDTSQPLAWTKSSAIQPGGEATTGSFTGAWASWWATEAPQVFDETIAPEVNREIDKSMKVKSRARWGKVGVNSITDHKKLMEQNARWAEANMLRFERRMRSRSNG